MANLKDGVRLTVGGAVSIGNGGYMHPYSFRDLMGEDAYQELLSRPAIVCEYDVDEHGNLIDYDKE